MTKDDLHRPLDETIRESFEEYRATFAAIESLLRQQFRLENILGSGLALYRWSTGEEHEVQDGFTDLRARGRDLRRRREGREIQSVVPRRLGEDVFRVPTSAPSSEEEPSENNVVEVPEGGRLRQIYDILIEAKRPLKTSDIAKRLVETGQLTEVKNPVPAVAAHLSRGCSEGIFFRPARGLYAVSEEVMTP